jgi:two-component system, NarL family, sensor histidine kinase UhpB
MRTVQQVETIYDRARAILRKLRPEIIDALGLTGSVEETVRAFARSHRTCTFELDAQALPGLH